MQKLYFLSCLLFVIPTLIKAQSGLEKHLNAPRPGDEIIKQQVLYKDPGRSGQNVLWDFGRLKTVNEAYMLSYSEPSFLDDTTYIMGADTIIYDRLKNILPFVGTEHYTQYYYSLSGDSLWVLGHENPTTLLKYTQPLLNTYYPMIYGDSLVLPYSTEGLYSGGIPIKAQGEVSICADAKGWMILPSGDTLRHITRIKNEQSIRQTQANVSGKDLSNNSVLQTYRWYSRGYRYPIFETIRSFTYGMDSILVKNFETAFFYPLPDHYYLEEDEENLAVLDDLLDDEIDPWAKLRYNFYPNPVSNLLYVELYLPRAMTVKVQLRSITGSLVLNRDMGSYSEGMNSFELDVTSLSVNNYILEILLEGHLISGIIMKR